MNLINELYDAFDGKEEKSYYYGVETITKVKEIDGYFIVVINCGDYISVNIYERNAEPYTKSLNIFSIVSHEIKLNMCPVKVHKERTIDKDSYNLIYLTGVRYGEKYYTKLTDEIIDNSSLHDIDSTLLGDYKEWTKEELSEYMNEDFIKHMLTMSIWRDSVKGLCKQFKSAVREPDLNSAKEIYERIKRKYEEIFK